MNICYLCSDVGIPLTGHKGASAHVRGILRALKGLGHEVVAVTSSADGDGGTGVPVFTIPRPDLFHRLPLEHNARTVRALRHVWNNVSTEQMLEKVFVLCEPDLMYERYSPFAVAGGILARKHGVPHILEVNALLAEEGKRFRKQALQEASEFLEYTAFDNTSLIVTVSDELQKALIDAGVSPSKILVVPNGVDDLFLYSAPSALHKEDDEKIIIGFVGSLKPWHAIDLIADSFRLLARDAKYHLLVVGDGPMMQTLRTLEKDLPRRVTLTGGVSHGDVPALMHRMDIVLAPYPPLDTFYFSPLKILEYMALGKAIVATDIGQIRDLIRHEETGLLVPTGDQEEFINAIQRLSADQKLRHQMGENAAREARSSHSWRHRAASIIASFHERCSNNESILAGPQGVR